MFQLGPFGKGDSIRSVETPDLFTVQGLDTRLRREKAKLPAARLQAVSRSKEKKAHGLQTKLKGEEVT